MPPTGNRERLVAVAFALVAVVVYLPAASGGFLIWDDNINLLHNPALEYDWGLFLSWAFTDIETVQRYKPLNWVLWRGVVAWTGLDPAALHLAGILLHAMNSALLFCLVRRFLSGQAVAEPAGMLAAVVATFTWAIHPLRVEPVAWISGLGYPLSAFFALLTLWAFVTDLQHPSVRLRWAALAGYALSLLCYPAAAGLPGLLFCLGAMHASAGAPPGSVIVGALRRVWPYLAASALILGLTLLTRQTTDSGIWRNPVSLDHIGLDVRFLQAFFVWAWPLQKTLVPVGLGPVYPDVWQLTTTSVAAWASVGAVLALTFLAWKSRHSWPAALPLWIGYLALAAPTLGVLDPPFSPADRYSYIPLLPITLLAATGLAAIFSHPGRRIRVGAAALATAASACLLMLTHAELRHWQSAETFFSRAIERLSPHRATADLHWRLGLHYLMMNRPESALGEFEQVLRINPRHPDAARYIRTLTGRPSGEQP